MCVFVRLQQKIIWVFQLFNWVFTQIRCLSGALNKYGNLIKQKVPGLQIRRSNKDKFSYFSTKTYIVTPH